jgi:hypothetical protein
VAFREQAVDKIAANKPAAPVTIARKMFLE